MDLINRINYTRFFGREFLTWLWFRSDRQEGLFKRGEEAVEVWFDSRLVLEAQGEVKEQNVIKAETPTDTDEAHASLATGKQVTEAKLRVIRDQKQWTFTIKGESLGMAGLKLPALLSREDDNRLYERFDLIEEIEGIVNELFGDFIELRLNDDEWRQEVTNLRDWVYGN